MIIILDHLKLRKAKLEDANTTYKWAADSTIRACSFNSNPPNFQSHIRWYKEKLNNKNCFYYIIEINIVSLGSIRFDIVGNEAIISYLVDPTYHGKGIGKILLSSGIEQFLSEMRDNKTQVIVGYVKKTNIASVKSFERFGFNKIDQNDTIKFEKWI